MLGKTILHYPPKADQPLADKILEKLGEGGLVIRSFQINLETPNDW